MQQLKVAIFNDLVHFTTGTTDVEDLHLRWSQFTHHLYMPLSKWKTLHRGFQSLNVSSITLFQNDRRFINEKLLSIPASLTYFSLTLIA